MGVRVLPASTICVVAMAVVTFMGLGSFVAHATGHLEGEAMSGRAHDHHTVKYLTGAAPGELSSVLGVLRRPRRPEDCLPAAVLERLRFGAVWPEGIRLVARSDRHERFYIVPGRLGPAHSSTERYDSDSPAVALEAHEPSGWVGAAIYSVADITEGRALQSFQLGNMMFLRGVVPDDVAAVEIEAGDRLGDQPRIATAKVTENFFSTEVNAGPVKPSGVTETLITITWHSVNGSVLKVLHKRSRAVSVTSETRFR